MQIIRIKLISSKGETKGCENAPLLVLNELKKIESNEKKELIEFEKLNLEEIHVNLQDLNEANYLIFQNCKEAFERNFKTFFIGGDHCIDYSIVKAFNKVEKNPLIIVFDAHADCLNGALNRSWIRKLILEESFSPKRILLISARNLGEEEMAFVRENGITWIGMDVLDENLDEICDLVMERARNTGGFYVSIDMDCLDPAFAPGAVEPEAGGLSSRDLIYFVKRLSFLDNFRGADIVEVNPDKDINGMTIKLAAKLIAEMM
jgi:arginase family enzyme